MKVRENSWFFKLFLTEKLQRKFRKGYPVDVCSVFWSSVGFISLYIVTAALIILLLTCFLLFVHGTITGSVKDLNPVVSLVGILASMCLMFVAAYFLLRYLIILLVVSLEKPVDKVGDWLDRYFADRKKEPKQPGLLSSYIKARKERMCTLVEFEHED